MTISLTGQQRDFIKVLLTTSANVALVARAGCGKTSTILAAVGEYVAKFPGHEVAICAFGKAVQKEIEGKLAKMGLTNWRQVQATTSHAMGFGLVRFLFKSSVDDNKVRDLVRGKNDPTYQEYGQQIKQLVHLAKLEGFGFFGDVAIGDVHAWYRLADHYGVNDFEDTSDLDRVIHAAQAIYEESLRKTDVVDFDDMILFPLIKNIRVKFTKDVIFVDEAQDTSRARRALVRKFVKPSGRLIVVGDDRQAIMGFAGASADAMGEFIRDLGAQVMPLNVTWRCPRAVVREAQRLVGDIEAAAEAPEGEVLKLASLPEELAATDAVLCRNTAPLIETAYSLIRRGVACKVEGRDIGQGLLKMVDRWTRITTVPAYLEKLEDYRDRECQKAVAKGKDQKVEEINDRCSTVRIICEAVQAKGLQSLSDVRNFITDLFEDDVSQKGLLTLCTYHRSKGREWPRVMLLEHSKRCPSPYAKQEWQLAQENNLAYVAITRAQQTLAYLR